MLEMKRINDDYEKRERWKLIHDKDSGDTETAMFSSAPCLYFATDHGTPHGGWRMTDQGEDSSID